MPNYEHLAVLRNGVEAWNNWRNANPDIKPNLKRATLTGECLCGANFQGANLRWAILRGVNLEKANLRGAILCNANLREANLQDADLSGANLYNVDMREANLTGTIFDPGKFDRTTIFPSDKNPRFD